MTTALVRSFAVTTLLALGGTVTNAAQDAPARPNFSGTWVADDSTSGEKIRIVIEQTPSVLKVDTLGAPAPGTMVMRLDAHAGIAPDVPRAIDRCAEREGVVRNADWKADVLVTECAPDADGARRLRSTWRLDGGKLVVDVVEVTLATNVVGLSRRLVFEKIMAP